MLGVTVPVPINLSRAGVDTAAVEVCAGDGITVVRTEAGDVVSWGASHVEPWSVSNTAFPTGVSGASCPPSVKGTPVLSGGCHQL